MGEMTRRKERLYCPSCDREKDRADFLDERGERRTHCRPCRDLDRPAPSRKCHDCGTPTWDYRCAECQDAWKLKHGLPLNSKFLVSEAEVELGLYAGGGGDSRSPSCGGRRGAGPRE